jgi:hypothetical protein
MPVGVYVSRDGELRFLVTCPDGDWTISFDGFAWHTHGSVLAAQSGQEEISAIDRFVADLTGNITVIVLTRRSGVLTDIWITDDPATISDYKTLRLAGRNYRVSALGWDRRESLIWCGYRRGAR